MKNDQHVKCGKIENLGFMQGVPFFLLGRSMVTTLMLINYA